MKVLTGAQMREVDRRTIELGISGPILMENAGHRVVEFLAEKFAPLSGHRIAIFCGKGNNGGDGLVIARQLFTRFQPAELHVVLCAPPEEMQGDAALNLRMLKACGCAVGREITPEMRTATIVVDALLGTGMKGPATGRMLEVIRQINSGFPLAKIVAVDIPSGLPSDTGDSAGESVRTDYTITFTAPKVGQVLPPNCDRVGELHVRPIGSPPELYERDDTIFLSLVEPVQFRHLLVPRPRGAHKGSFGHVLVVGGSPGKTGAAAMAGLAALRAGAGLVTVASQESAIATIAGHAPELMTEPLPEVDAFTRLQSVAENKDVLALGPGLGTQSNMVTMAQHVFQEFSQPMVVDADGLNALARIEWSGRGALRVLTPHPGEMSRLCGKSTQEIQSDRVGIARAFAVEKGVVVVLKGQRTLIAFTDGRVWINPTGTPAMASGGTGDILTGLIAGFLGQFPRQPDLAIAAAVYLHGLSGQVGAAELGEQPLIATDLLHYLPAAMHASADLSNPL